MSIKHYNESKQALKKHIKTRSDIKHINALYQILKDFKCKDWLTYQEYSDLLSLMSELEDKAFLAG